MVPSSAQDTERDEAYLSDTGKVVALATKERDNYIKSRRGRHRKVDLQKIAELDSSVLNSYKVNEIRQIIDQNESVC